MGDTWLYNLINHPISPANVKYLAVSNIQEFMNFQHGELHIQL